MNRNIIIYWGVFFLAACSSSSGSPAPGSGTGAGTGPAGPAGGTFLVACDNPFGASAASTVHMCDNYYANAATAAFNTMVDESLCTAGGGTILTSPCTTDDSVGGCVINPSGGGSSNVFSAGNSEGYYVVQIFYSPGATVASTQANCATLPAEYVPYDGGTPSGTAGTGMDGGAVGTEDAGSGNLSAPDGDLGSTCTMTVTGDQASGVGTYTVQGQAIATLPSASVGNSSENDVAQIGCLANFTTDGGLAQASWQEDLPGPVHAPVTDSFPPGAGTGGVYFEGVRGGLDNNQWSCSSFEFPDGGVENRGTYTFTLSSAVAIPYGVVGTIYQVKASGHAVCPNENLDPVTGLPMPGLVTIDLTMD